jgi:uncharacterized membrane protein YgcG
MVFGSARGLVRLIVLAAALAALLAGCAAAPGALLLRDETELLPRAEVEAAAAPLIGRGALVAVFAIERGDATGADLTRRLGEAGLLDGGQIAPGSIALYVSYEPRYSELRAGASWSRLLPDEALREIREGALNPALRDGRPGEGVAAALAAVEERLASPPLEARIARVLSWIMYAVLAGFALFLLTISPLGPWLGRTPPGRLARWLVDQTPPGRRRLERIIATTRRRLEDRAEYARGWCRGAAAAPQGPALMNRLKILDQERATLAGLSGRALEEAMDELAWGYTYLGNEAAGLAPGKPKAKRSKGAAASTAAGLGITASSDSYTSSSSDSSSSSGWDSGSSSSSDSGSSSSSDGGAW